MNRPKPRGAMLMGLGLMRLGLMRLGLMGLGLMGLGLMGLRLMGLGLLGLELLACDAASRGGNEGDSPAGDAAADAESGDADGGSPAGDAGDAMLDGQDGGEGSALDGEEGPVADGGASDGLALADGQVDVLEDGMDGEPEVPCDDVPAGCGAEPEPGVRIDGAFADWAGVAPLMQDAVGDADFGAIDFGRVWVAHDPTWLFLRVEVGKVMNLQESNGLVLYVDTDGNAETGKATLGLGAELEWVAGQRRGTWYGPAGTVQVGHAQVGFVSLPTYASSEFELALRRDAMPNGATSLVVGPTISVALRDRPWASGGDRVPQAGMTPPSYELEPAAQPAVEVIPLERSAASDLRFVTWNMLANGFIQPERAPAFRRILAAIRPDIITFQEGWDVKSSQVKAAMAAWVPLPAGQEWSVGNYEGLIVSSRFPLLGMWTDDPLERVQAVLVDAPLGKVLLFNAHLQCCEDEESRQRQADGLMAFLRAVREGSGPPGIPVDVPVVIQGDMNLVGGPGVRETLMTGSIADEGEFGPSAPPDVDGSDLVDLVSRGTDAPLSYTFRKDVSGGWAPGSTMPGRLDYILFGDAVLEVARHFVLDTREMQPDALARHGLEPLDSAVASDHAPHVADLRLH